MNIAEYIRNKEKKVETPSQTPEDALNQYSNCSEEQLMSELFRLGSLSSGKISPKELDSFFNNAKPYLAPEQLARMADLIQQLKNS